MLDQLRARAKWLRDMDSGSGDAQQIEWAVSQIERKMAEWRSVSELTPKDGDQIWAYLYGGKIRLLEYVSPETSAREEGGDPKEYDGVWADPDNHDDNWQPKWYLPVDVIPALPAY